MNRFAACLLAALLYVAPAFAQMSGGAMFPGPGMPASTAVAFSLTATDSATDLTTQTMETYASKAFAIGAADSTRKVAVCFSARTSAATPNASSVTIGGVTATKVDNVLNGTNGGAELWFAAVPTGTTATVSIVFSASNSRSAIEVYSIVGSTSDPGAGNHGNSIANDPTATITIQSGGAAIGCEFTATGYSSTPTVTGTPAGFNHVDQDTNLVSGVQGFASLHSVGISGSQTLTIVHTGSPGTSAGVFGAWGP